MSAKFLGAHVPTSGGLPTAIERALAIGCTAVQVFTTSPRQWASRPLSPEIVAKWRSEVARSGITKFVSHDSYLVNLSSRNPENIAKSIEFLKNEMIRCSELEIPYVVSHMGGYKDRTVVDCLPIVAENALRVLAETPDNVTLLMETTAGQGEALNSRFEEIAMIMELTKNPARLQVCLDTCHIFAAGYDIRTQETYEQTFESFDRLIGISAIRCIHCNDSKKKFGTRVDRHEHIGDGEIGIEAFRLLVNDPRFSEVPIVLETPDAEEMHGENLRRLRALIGT